jgi:hypothetical protein
MGALTLITCILCGNLSPDLTGGGSDTEVSGRIVAATGAGVAGVRVALIPSTYNPVFDTALLATMIVMTDANGSYQFKEVNSGQDRKSVV